MRRQDEPVQAARPRAGREEIVIAKAGRPVAKLVRVERPDVMNAFGALKGRFPSVPDEVWFERDIENERLRGDVR